MPYREPIRTVRERPPSPPQRNISQSSSHTTSSTSSLEAAPIRPPPIQTRTAATSSAQLPPQDEVDRQEREIRRDSDSRTRNFQGNAGYHREGSQSPVTPRPDRYSFAQARGDTMMAPRSLAQQQQQYHHPAPVHLLPLELRPSASGPDLASLRKEMMAASASSGNTPGGDSALAEDDHQSFPDSPTRGSTLPGHARLGGTVDGMMGSMTITPTKKKHRARSSSGQAGTPGSGGGNNTKVAVTGGGGLMGGSTASQGGGSGRGDVRKVVGLQDFTFGEMIGRGSYSTVVLARQNATNIPYAIKILDQAHLIQQKKTKYAKVERDALVRLGPVVPRTNRGSVMSTLSTSTVTGPNPGSHHRRRGSGQSVASSSGGGGVMGGLIAAGTEPGKPRTRRESIEAGGWNVPARRTSTFQGSGHAGQSGASSSSYTAKSWVGGGTPTSGTINLGSSYASSTTMMDGSGRRGTSEPPGDEQAGFAVSTNSKPDLTKLAIPTSPLFSAGGNQLPLSPTTMSTSPLEGAAAGGSRRPTELTESGRPVQRKRKRSTHPGVIKLHYTFKDHTSLYFVLDLAINGELLDVVRKYGSLDIDSARRYGAQIIDTVEFMHERGVIHRDLKPENILLDDDWRIKITDFGSAKVVDPVTLEPVEEPEAEGKKRSFVGTAEYVSPEVLRNEHASVPADIWAFGCVLFQIIAGRPPFRGATEYLTFQKVLACEYEFPEGFDATAKGLIERILTLNPADRPSVNSIKQDPFFEQINFSSLWTDHASDIKTGMQPPLKANQPTIDFTDAFGTPVSSPGWERDEMVSDEDGLGITDGDAIRGGQTRTTVEPKLPFPNHLSEGTDRLREPQRKWIEESGQTFSSEETVEEAANKAKLRATAGGVDKEPGLSRKLTHQWEQEERRQLWAQHLREGEQIVYQSPILTRAGIFLPKRRTLVLTNLRRLLCVKEDAAKNRIKVEGECIFSKRSSSTDEKQDSLAERQGSDQKGLIVKKVSPKGPRAFQVQTAEKDHTFFADREDIRSRWMQEFDSIRG